MAFQGRGGELKHCVDYSDLIDTAFGFVHIVGKDETGKE
ncbi:uncharacterized protein G2W53_034417 [Senna tora]|uniref:Uncharacterized protein n=1 Tax=Senna tora TaxID=362788 RepID=A0A834WBW3_9FABA|nr:uncharacterized protein G2W53_034417 [Senna tora]